MNEGLTTSEQLIFQLAKKTCLSLWSYVNPKGKGGKELCDILVVCDPHVIVISVKDIALGNSGDVRTDWERWRRKAIDNSVKQLDGAVRWLEVADRVVRLDGEDGLPLPARSERRYHLVAVAFGAGRQVPFVSPWTRDGPLVHVLDEGSSRLLLQ